MRNRWFHVPQFRTPAEEAMRRSGWLELLYDLAFMAAILRLGGALARHADVWGAVCFAGLFVPLWFTWTGFTFYTNRFKVDDLAHRAAVLAQMLGLAAVAAALPAVFAGDGAPFAWAYTAVRAIHALIYARLYAQQTEARALTGRYAAGFGAGVVLWGVSALVPEPWRYGVWALAMAWDLWVPLGSRARDLLAQHPPDLRHMAERYGLLTLVVLGGALVRVVRQASQLTPSLALVGVGALVLLVLAGLWWIYFDDVAGSELKTVRLASVVWVYAHLPLAVSITAAGVAMAMILSGDLSAPASPSVRWLLAGGVGVALLAVGAIDAVTERRQAELADRMRVQVRVGSALVVPLVAALGWLLPAAGLLGVVAAICVAQVIADLMIAPEADDVDMMTDQSRVSMKTSPPPSPGPKTPDEAVEDMRRLGPVSVARDSVRIGTPSRLRRDLYFYFMEASWSQLFGVTVVVFLLSNAVFAGLYLLEPWSVTDVQPDNFWDAFFFSVQTMSTIGYGGMAPASLYAHIVVTLEAAVGLLGVALITGLIFAKVARPEASVLFSEIATIAPFEGTPTLAFRVGNARGNEVVEATVRVVALCDEVTAEGERMRRLYDMRLVRSRSPIFSLTWTVLHPLDADSPLFTPEGDGLPDKLSFLIVTMTGYDATYAQTVHARHYYRRDQIRVGARFVDVIEPLPDGRLSVDYRRFHETIDAPLAPPPASDPEDSDSAGR